MKSIRLNKDLKITCALIILILIVSVVGITIQLTDKDNFREGNYLQKGINLKNFREYYSGSLVQETKLDNRYFSVLYENNKQYESHLVDLKSEKEIDVMQMIKEKKQDLFYKKVRELMLLKFPSKITSILLDCKKTYFWDEDSLIIYYYPDNLETTREFTLTVDYNEIKDFLVFKPSLNKIYQNETGFTYDPGKVSIALTFDDGPNGERTKTIIDALEDYKMSATFFMLGSKLESNADVVKKVYDSHSEVGYHSYKHVRFTTQSTEQIASEFKLSDETFYQITCDHIKLTRPPYGNYNQNVLNAIDNAFIRWNIDTNDWQYKDVDYLVNYVLTNLKDRSIILFHDSYDSSIEAVLRLVEQLYLRDIQVLSVSEMAKLTNTSLENHEVYFSFN